MMPIGSKSRDRIIDMITIRVNGKPYITDTLMRGIFSSDAGLTNSQQGAPDTYVRIANAMDLYKDGFEGHITSPQTFAQGSMSNAGITTTPKEVAVDVTSATPNIHHILKGASGIAPKTVRSTLDSYLSSASISAHGGHNFTTMGSVDWGQMIIAYTANDGSSVATNYIFYIWNDSNDGDMGRMAVDGSSADDDFLSTVAISGAALTSGVPHRAVEAGDKKLYITNGRFVSSFDGATGNNGTFNATAYDCGRGWVATDVRFEGNRLVVSMIKSGTTYVDFNYVGESRVTYWDMNEVGLGLVYPIHDYNISAIFPIPRSAEFPYGLLAFTRGRNNTVKVWEFVGTGFKMIWESVIFSVSPEPSAIEYFRGNVYWLPGDIMALMLDLKTKGVHAPLQINDGSNNASGTGFLRNVYTNTLYAGGLFGASYKAVFLTPQDANYLATSSDLRTRLYVLPPHASISNIWIGFSQSISGYSSTFSIFKDYSNVSVGTLGTDFLRKTITTAGITEMNIDNVSIPDVTSFYMNIRLSRQVSVRDIIIDCTTA